MNFLRHILVVLFAATSLVAGAQSVRPTSYIKIVKNSGESVLITKDELVSMKVSDGVVIYETKGGGVSTIPLSEMSEFKASQYPHVGYAAVDDKTGSGITTCQWVQLWDDGPKFAVMNVGATSPEDYGGYYAMGSSTSREFVDVATQQWGSNWRMPTYEELTALYAHLAKTDGAHCSGGHTTQNGVEGFLIKGQNEYSFDSLFLPYAGETNYGFPRNQGIFGKYWSSTFDEKETPVGDYLFYVHLDEYTPQVLKQWSQNRVIDGLYQYSVRAVLDEQKDDESKNK